MHSLVAEELRSAGSNLLEAYSQLKETILQNERFELSDSIPGADYSFAEIGTGIAALCTFVAGIEIKDAGPFIPKSFLDGLLAKLKEIHAQCLEIEAAFGAHSGIKSWSAENFVATYRDDTQFNFSKPLRILYGRLDAAYTAWYLLRTVLRTPRISEFGRLVAQMEEKHSFLQDLDSEIEELRSSTRNAAEKSAKELESASATSTEIERLLKDSEASRKTIAEYLAEATTKASEIKAVEERALSLDSTISEYQANFDAFDEELKNRSARYTQESAKLEEIHKSLDIGRNEIGRLTSEAEGLLRGATNVGLAASFSNLQAKIASELNWSRASFYLSICFLIVLSIPIALYVFPGLQSLVTALGIDVAIVVPKGAIGDQKTPDTLAQIAARALLLIPGIWLVRFTSARHERLFRLREQYAYKYSVASSVEGFKKQAPELEQGIAAAAFYELTFNPATRMDAGSEESRYPNPVMEWIMKKLGGPHEK